MEVKDYIERGIFPQFQNNGYKIKSEEEQPLIKEKKIHPEYKTLRSYQINIEKDTKIGTEIQLGWDKNKLDRLQIKTESNTTRKEVVKSISSVVFVIFFYVLTVIYYEYWFVVFVSLFICFFITILLVILPAFIGVIIGLALGSIIFSITTSKEKKAQNNTDRTNIHNWTVSYAKKRVIEYRKLYKIPPPPPPPIKN
jgi:hypothetical protein